VRCRPDFSASDAELTQIAPRAETLPTGNLLTSADYLNLPQAKAARTEIFKRALRTPIQIKPGHGP
jgi:hypothetical protein